MHITSVTWDNMMSVLHFCIFFSENLIMTYFYFQLKSVGFNSDESVVKEFGLSVSDRFEKVEARILNAPRLEYNTEVVSIWT